MADWNPLQSIVNIKEINDTGGITTREDKVNVLLQAYISRAYVEDFALVSDTLYVAQNGGRITRALLEIALSERWGGVSAVFTGISKAIEKRMWPFQNPLCQFPLSQDLLHHLQQWADDYSPAELASKSAMELGELIHMNERQGAALLKAVKQFPSAEISYRIRPINSELLRLEVDVQAHFTWDSRVHGFVEPFWLWVEDWDGVDILQLDHLVFKSDASQLKARFHIPVSQVSQHKVRLRFVSDKWLGAETEIDVPLDEIKIPGPSTLHRPLLDLPLLSLSALQCQSLRQNVAQKFATFNAVQTQSFWPVVHSKRNAILSGPAGCGKSTLGYICLL
jgi:antiviral helicase SLH1